jgi:hypothetical protein
LVNGKPFTSGKGFAIVKGSSMLAVFPHFDTSSLAIVNIRLKAINESGDPAVLVYDALKPYFQLKKSGLKYTSVSFNIKPEDEASLKKHHSTIRKTVATLRK